ncbi:MAG: ankyrin repeat domain-containing protein [Deltaproteobacteria bacterium]|nr:ankyrin repeat domain-containing protein [Deltaproteobacteria bacterium]
MSLWSDSPGLVAGLGISAVVLVGLALGIPGPASLLHAMLAAGGVFMGLIAVFVGRNSVERWTFRVSAPEDLITFESRPLFGGRRRRWDLPRSAVTGVVAAAPDDDEPGMTTLALALRDGSLRCLQPGSTSSGSKERLRRRLEELLDLRADGPGSACPPAPAPTPAAPAVVAETPPDEALREAVTAGDAAAAGRALERGADPDAKCPDGSSALGLALEAGLPAVERELLARGARAARGDRLVTRALFEAVEKQYVERVRALLAAGADPNATDEIGRPLIFEASDIKEGAGLVRLLLDHGADPNSRNAEGRTLLRHAMAWRNEPLAILLVERGADPNDRLNVGWTVLHDAILENMDGLARALLERGADPDATDGSGCGPLGWAIEPRHAAIAAALARRTADPNQRARGGLPVLVHAALAGMAEIVEILLDRGVPVDADGGSGFTALMAAAGAPRPEVVRLLLRRGAAVDRADADGETALLQVLLLYEGDEDGGAGSPGGSEDLAAAEARGEVVRLLLEAGAGVSCRNAEGESALERARRLAPPEVAALLCESPGGSG